MTPWGWWTFQYETTPDVAEAIHEENRRDWSSAGRMGEVEKRAYGTWRR